MTGGLLLDDLMSKSGLPLANEPNATLTMSMAEGLLLLQQILRSDSYIEWGSGGSTELVSHLILSKQVRKNFHANSIESSTDWMNYMRTRTASKIVARAEASGHLTFIHGNIGPTRHLGFPVRPVSPEQAMRYVGAIGSTIQAHAGYDTVLVDGRFRLACLLVSLRFLKRDGAALIHDFSPRPLGARSDIWRGRFATWSRALQHYRLAQKNHTLALLAPLHNTSVTEHELTVALRYADR